MRIVNNTQSVHLFVLEECGSGECPASFISTQISHEIAKPSAERVDDTYVQEFLFAVDRRNIDMRQNKFGMAMSPYPA